MVCVAGDLPVAPTATRWNVDVIYNALSMDCPYSYAVERWGDLQRIIMDCPYSYAVERLDDLQCIINCPYCYAGGVIK